MREIKEFDFEKHAKSALKDYMKVIPRYKELSRKVASILKEALDSRNIIYHSITYRAKSEDSFVEKTKVPNPENPREPKYKNPLNDITDKAGTRIITYFIKTQKQIDNIINKEFNVIEKIDQSEELLESEKFGYLSVHYLVRLKEPRLSLTEYSNFKGMICEIQVRTILQHAWAEIEHNIQYKSDVDIPHNIRRRFISLAVVLENADKEFQLIHDEDKRLKNDIAYKIKKGKIKNIEISSASVRFLLEKIYGADSRVSEWTYSWFAKLVLNLGIKNISTLEKILNKTTDYGLLYKYFWRTRPSPPTIAEDVLFLHFKEKFIKNHLWANEPWFVKSRENRLKEIFGKI